VRVARSQLACDGRAAGPLYVQVAWSRVACASGTTTWAKRRSV